MGEKVRAVPIESFAWHNRPALSQGAAANPSQNAFLT
jgi:hypothetical protein